MTEFDDLLVALRTRQDNLDAARERVWPNFTEFRDGLLGGLRTFASAALRSGMRGVKQAVDTPISDSAVETSLMLNYWDIGLLYPSRLSLDPSRFVRVVLETTRPTPDKIVGGFPAFRIWISAGPEGDRSSYGYIDAGRHSEFFYQFYRVTAFNETFPVMGTTDLTKNAGQQAAQGLIRYFYSCGPEHVYNM